MKIQTGLIVAAVLALAAPVAARDRKAYHGANCFNAAGFAKISAVYGAYADGGSAVFECPLIRDRLGAANSLPTDNVTVEGYNASGTYMCQLATQTEDGNSGTYISFIQETTTATGRIQLGLEGTLTNGLVGGNEGSFSLECAFNNGGYLYHILVDETDDGSE